MTRYILVCIDGHPKSHRLLAAGYRRAQETGLPLRLLFANPVDEALGSTSRQHARMRLLDKARASGAEVTFLERPDWMQAALEHLHAAFGAGDRIEHVFVGRHGDGDSLFWRRKGLAERVAAEFGTRAQVTVVPLEGGSGERSFWRRLDIGPLTWRTLFVPIVAVALAYALAELGRMLLPAIFYKINMHNVVLVFLLACVVVALRFGAISALIASFLSVGLINYAYVVPIRQFNIGTMADIISIVIFLLAAVVVSFLGGHVRANADRARRREQRTNALYEINKLTSEAENIHQLLEILNRELGTLLRMDVAFFLHKPTESDGDEADAGDVPVFAKYPDQINLPDVDIRALEKCWQTNMPTGLGTLRGIGAQWYFEPISTVDRRFGVFGVNVPLNARLDPGFSQLITALADHTAMVLERLDAIARMNESRFREEREKLRAMLLSSVSHDLKTPLASVIGSISVLRSLQQSGRLTDEHQDTLTETALDEAQRLDSFISNILSMTRLESGDIHFTQEQHDPMEPLGRVRKSLRTRLRGRKLNITNGANGVTVTMDGMMTTQVLQNVIDNAAKYSPKGTDIDVTLARDKDGFSYRVRDRGPGIPDDQLDRVFDKYERLNKQDSQVAGTGLGLAIAKTVMTKQGGDIRVHNHEEGGAEFVVWFPDVTSEKTGEPHEQSPPE